MLDLVLGSSSRIGKESQTPDLQTAYSVIRDEPWRAPALGILISEIRMGRVSLVKKQKEKKRVERDRKKVGLSLKTRCTTVKSRTLASEVEVSRDV